MEKYITEYKTAVKEQIEKTDDLALLDLIYKILLKSN